MIYFDTNVLIYSIVNQDLEKMDISIRLIEKSIEDSKFSISTLSLQEFLYSLSRLKIPALLFDKSFFTFSKHCLQEINGNMISDAYALCKKVQNIGLIIDAIHLKFAERYCNKLITFDKDFKIFIPHTQLQIEILD